MQPQTPFSPNGGQSNELAELLLQKDELIEMLAHDLNNPLTTIIMAAETMRGECSGRNPHLHSLIRDIQTSADRMRRLIQKSLTVKNLQNKVSFLELEPMPLLPAVNATVRRNEAMATGKGIGVSVISSAKNDWIKADQDALDMVLDVLLTNAMKCTPEGGNISVGMSNEGNEVVVNVTDSGPILTPEQASKVFDKTVHRSSKRAPGERPLGIGVIAVKELAEMMGGGLALLPSIEGGATFALRFPVDAAVG